MGGTKLSCVNRGRSFESSSKCIVFSIVIDDLAPSAIAMIYLCLLRLENQQFRPE